MLCRIQRLLPFSSNAQELQLFQTSLCPFHMGADFCGLLNWSFLPSRRFLCALVPVSFPISDKRTTSFTSFVFSAHLLSTSSLLAFLCLCSCELWLSCSVSSSPDRQALLSRTHLLEQRWHLPMAFRRRTVNLVSRLFFKVN